jgi:hypothetical protein
MQALHICCDAIASVANLGSSENIFYPKFMVVDTTNIPDSSARPRYWIELVGKEIIKGEGVDQQWAGLSAHKSCKLSASGITSTFARIWTGDKVDCGSHSSSSPEKGHIENTLKYHDTSIGSTDLTIESLIRSEPTRAI